MNSLFVEMDDGELDITNDVLGCYNGGDWYDVNDPYTENLGPTQACTHAHACNPSGPDQSHTHTCIHVHTQILPTPSESQGPSDDTAESTDKKRTKQTESNRAAVRKYREKRKARTASLEDEVVKLRALNQHLMKRVQNQAVLEAEIARLKCLLVDIRGRIEGEIGVFPYQRPSKNVDAYQNVSNPNIPGTYVMNPCNMQRTHNDPMHCLHPGADTGLNGQGLGDCAFDNLQCLGDQNSGFKEFPDCGLDNANGPYAANTSSTTRRRGTRGGAMPS